jgi:hypothetical protein
LHWSTRWFTLNARLLHCGFPEQELEAMDGLDQPTAAVVHNNVAAAGLAAGVVSKKAAADALRRLEGLFERSGGRLTPALEVCTSLITPVQS